MSAYAAGDALRGLSSVPILISVVSLLNHSGVNFEISGSRSAIRGNRVRGTLFLIGLLMFGVGSTLRVTALGEGAPTPARLFCVWLLLGLVAASEVAFLVYRPRTVVESRSEVVEGAHSAPRAGFVGRSGVLWAGFLAFGVLAGAIAVILIST